MNETGLLPAIEERRAYRGYSDKPVPSETVERILEAARRAPSCANKQPARFLVLTEPEALEAGRACLTEGNYWAAHAPILVFTVTKNDLDCQLSHDRRYAQFDTGLAVENLLLQAVHEGLVAHPMAGFLPDKVHELFSISEEFDVVTAIAIGFPGEGAYLNEKHKELERSPQRRKPLEETVFMNSFTI